MLEIISRAALVVMSLLPAMLPAGPAAAQSAPSMQAVAVAASNKTAVETMLKAWMGGDGGALRPLLADDIEWTIAGNSVAAGTTRGWNELSSKVLAPFGARFAKGNDRFRPRRINGVYADGDLVVAHFDGAGITNDGKVYANSYVWLLTMRDGKIAKGIAYFDSLAFNELWRVAPAQD